MQAVKSYFSNAERKKIKKLNKNKPQVTAAKQ